MDLIIGKIGDTEVSIDAQELVTGRTCIIAQSGAGKSWAIAVICERLCRKGIGFCIIDTEGEYHSLKEKYPLLWLGSDERADLDIETVNIREVMIKAVRNSSAVIYDVSETDMRDRVNALAQVLYDIASELRLPYLLIIEEADKFIPQSRDSSKTIEEISRRGRKRGLGILVATQRPSLVNKNVLSQCSNQIIGKLTIENDLRAVDLFFASRKEVEELVGLRPGEFFVMGKLTPQKLRFTVGQRETKHRGLTPKLIPRPILQRVETNTREGDMTRETSYPSQTAVNPDREVRSGFRLSVNRERAMIIAEKLRKKSLLPSRQEHIASVDPLFWPIIAIKGRYLGGTLRRTPRDIHFLMDGVKGCLIDLSHGLRVMQGFQGVCGISAEGVRVLYALPASGATVADLEASTSFSPAVVRDALHELGDLKLVTDTGKLSPAKLYVPLLRFRPPRLRSLQYSIPAIKEEVSGPFIDPVINERDLRSILKGLEPTADILSWAVHYYPLYQVRFTSSRGERTAFIDAIYGTPISFPP